MPVHGVEAAVDGDGAADLTMVRGVGGGVGAGEGVEVGVGDHLLRRRPMAHGRTGRHHCRQLVCCCKRGKGPEMGGSQQE